MRKGIRNDVLAEQHNPIRIHTADIRPSRITQTGRVRTKLLQTVQKGAEAVICFYCANCGAQGQMKSGDTCPNCSKPIVKSRIITKDNITEAEQAELNRRVRRFEEGRND